ncbi:outer membrane protein with beta-barrel domain [Algoriphagus aquaeductus]|uniref:Outer membrane protein with beta-barrel domain n=1 Tax=Algoriphagus aquaeductus TaxID=475299 RepID=A0A326RTR1_9BACT|nr:MULTISPECIES: porin family protein [Algoriphagus]PZV84611.1 outer membrane protein with beta-barrel domain [Algoriphagus aquaeductus]
MRKILLIAALFAANAFAVEAQSGLGIRGGVNFFNFGGNDVSENNYTNRAGFHAGAYASLGGGAIAIEPGIFYSVKGTQNEDAINSRAILDYVDVPVLLRLRAGEGFNVFAGPQISFLTRSKIEGDFGGSTVSLETGNIRETDTGLVFGVGYNMPKGFNIQGSYDYGMTPVFKDSNADVYNRGFKLSFGYTF